MKILQVSHGLPPKEKAGVELYTFYLSKALADLGHQVHVFCREEDPGKEQFTCSVERADGFNVTRIVNNLTWISDPRIYYDNHFFDRAFSEVLEREHPDVVHFQHFIALSAHLLKIAREKGIPVVITLHDFFILCHRIHLMKGDQRLCPGPLYGLECVSCLDFISPPRDPRIRALVKARAILPFPVIKWTKRFFIPSRYLEEKGYEVFHRYRFMHELFKLTDLILTPSHFVRKMFLKYHPFIAPKTRVVPLGIFPIDHQKQGKERGEKIRFCYVGNILPIKGIHLLVDVFKQLPPGRSILTLYGDRTSWNEAYYDRLKKEASGYSVDFRGPFERKDLSAALKDQDVLVLPSICYESFSFVIREANSMGLPVIASSIGAIPEAIEDGQNGFLFESGNPDDLKRCMLRFIDEPRLIQQMGSKMPKVKFMAEHAGELVKLYKMIINTSGLKGKD